MTSSNSGCDSKDGRKYFNLEKDKVFKDDGSRMWHGCETGDF